MASRNNVTRLLDSKKIPYKTYELSAEKLGALETARLLDVDLATVFKTIVVTGKESKTKPVLAVIPGNCQLDLKALAKAIGVKKMSLPTERAAERLTGLQAGGISPLALINKGFQVVIDQTAMEHDEVHVSGGQRGLNISLPIDALIELTKARIAKISLSL